MNKSKENKENKVKAGLELLREKFPSNQVGKLPKPTKSQTNEVKADFKNGARCKVCGGWHHPKVIHLDYVGHAALTDRLLDCDPFWNWEPCATDERGLPLFDAVGGLWIRLTVCGVTRPGYGWADGGIGGDASKEAVGDALRNAAMRFGAALDLWHKGELHQLGDDANLNGNGNKEQAENLKPVEGKNSTYDLSRGKPSQNQLKRLWAVMHSSPSRSMDDLKNEFGLESLNDLLLADYERAVGFFNDIPVENKEVEAPV